MIAQVNGILKSLQPFIVMVALLFGVIAAWGALADLLPVLKQIWMPRIAAQQAAIVGACLALIGGRI